MRWPWQHNWSAGDIDTIPIGVDVAGQPVTCSAAVHTYVLGATGSGKGSITANWIRSQAHYIHDGLVIVDFIDLKWGMEAAMYPPSIVSHTATSMAEALALLHTLRDELGSRAEVARGHTRQLHPTTETPRRLLVIDEATSLTSAGSKKEIDEAMQLLGELLRVGRALGLVVLALSQNPRVQGLPVRDLFSQRIALRLASDSEARMALGDDAVDAGAAPWRISDHDKGSGFLVDMDTGEVRRFHAPYVSDMQLAAL